MAANGILENAIIAVPLKYLSNFYRSLEMLLIKCKVELKLKCTKYFVLATGSVDNTLHEKMYFCIKYFFSKCDQILSFQQFPNPSWKTLFFVL